MHWQILSFHYWWTNIGKLQSSKNLS
jgi:hypothetical protein